MDASKMFNTILDKIETSQLNYSMIKTPFSATISLKKSYIKRIQSSSQRQGEDINYKVSGDINDLEKLTNENKKLKKAVIDLKETVAFQKDALDDKFKLAKEKSKVIDDEIAVFRDELIQVKKERSKIGSQVKSLQDENAHLKSEIKCHKHECDDLQKDLKKITKKHETDVNRLEKEKESVKKNANKLKEQVLDLEQQIEESKIVVKNKVFSTQTEEAYECHNCAKAYPSEQDLVDHIESNHHKKTTESYSQTSNIDVKTFSESNTAFVEYQCFYCGFLVKSRTSLLEHSTSCGKLVRKPLVTNAVPVVKNEDQMNVFKSYLQHLQTITSRKFQCMICQETFEFDTLLEMHKMFTHPKI